MTERTGTSPIWARFMTFAVVLLGVGLLNYQLVGLIERPTLSGIAISGAIVLGTVGSVLYFMSRRN